MPVTATVSPAINNSIGLAAEYLPLLDEIYKADSKSAVLDTAQDRVRWDQNTGSFYLFETSMVAILVSAMCALIRVYGGFDALLYWIRKIFKGKKGVKIDLVTDRIDDVGKDALKCKKLALPSNGSLLDQLTFNF